MKKKLLIAIIAIVCVVGGIVTTLILLLKNQTQVSHTVAGSEQMVEIEPGEFPYGEYKLIVTYASGETEEIPLTEDMIPEEEKIKLYRRGKQKIAVFYNGAKCEISVNVKYKSLEHVQLKDKTVVYTGQPFSMVTEGDLPADVTVRYPYGNSFTNAGEYDVTAVIYGDSYQTLTLSAKLTILKADYDMSGVTFSDATFSYDGMEKSVAVAGDLPRGLTVSYLIGSQAGNSAIDAGEYIVTARFSSDNPNYNPVGDMSARLTVEKAEYDMEGVTLANVNAVYDKIRHGVELIGNLPDGVSVDYYTTKKTANSDGSPCGEEEVAGNGATDAGVYLVTLYFSVADGKNYASVQPMTADLVIERAEYILTGAYLNAAMVTYNGSYQTLTLEGEQSGSEATLPSEVSVGYTVKKTNDPNGNLCEEEEVEGNGATDAGAYLVTAHFTLQYDGSNYLPVQSLSAVLVISQATVTVSGVAISDGVFDYDGQRHALSLSGNLPQGVTVRYTIRKVKNADGSACVEEEVEGNGATEAGTYEVYVEIVPVNENYRVEAERFVATLVINAASSGGEE